MAKSIETRDGIGLPASLWTHQRDALAVIEAYLASGETNAAALVTMPTGTGKTGVIGCSVLMPSAGHRLVLAPRVAIAHQLLTDLKGRFWKHVGTRTPDLAIRKLPVTSRLHELVDADYDTVYVGTIQALVTAMRTAGTAWGSLVQRVGLVVVDEGHYEPAPAWSRAIRQLVAPTVLLTATPFRNDLKTFRIAEGHTYRFSHHRAESSHLLRRPNFERIDSDSPAEFVDRLVTETETLAQRHDDVRAVVRCESADTVEYLTELLRSRGEKAIGIHERFATDDPRPLYPHVPAVTQDARYWVHQYKLIEGIDDHRFRVVAFYDVLRNDRAVIQQIGRALRNPGRSKGSTALVLSRSRDRDPQRVWYAYERFDLQDDQEAVASVPGVVEAIVDGLPEAFYFEGGFKTPLDPEDPNGWRDFAYPLRTQVYQWMGPDIPTVEDLEAPIRSEWEDIDRRVYPTQRPPDTVLIPYVSVENSPLLRDATFVEPKFGYTVFRIIDDLLFYFDARGRVPGDVKGHWRRLPPHRLHQLLPQHDRTTLTAVSLLNTDLGPRSARARSLRAANISELAPDLADHMYVCSTTEGYTGQGDDRHRRYVGLGNARVTDHRSGDDDFTRWHQWITELSTAVGRRRKATPALRRYATLIDAPASPDPAHVLIDVDPGHYYAMENGRLQLEDAASEVVGGRASLVANGKKHELAIRWDHTESRYRVAGASLQAEGFRENGEGRELVHAINDDQTMRIVAANGKAIYTRGQFYASPVPTGPNRIDYPWVRLLEPMSELAEATSEKGGKPKADVGDGGWPPDSVFGLIDSIRGDGNAPEPFERLFPNPSLLLCTDMGSEVADFVVVGDDRIAMIHAKHGKSVHSASALHEVIGQAMKNLHHLQPLDPPIPSTDNWCTPWPNNKVPAAARQRVGRCTSESELWAVMRETITDPNSQREIWMVLGRTLKKSEVEAHLWSSTPSPQTIQIYGLLQNAWSSAQQLGVRLRVFCSP